MADIALLEAVVLAHLEGRDRAGRREDLGPSLRCHHHRTVRLNLGRGAGHTTLARQALRAGALMVVRPGTSEYLERERISATPPPDFGVLCAANAYLNAHHDLLRPVGHEVREWVVKEPNGDPLHPSNWIVFDNSADHIEHLMHYWPSCLEIPAADLFTYIFLQ